MTKENKDKINKIPGCCIPLHGSGIIYPKWIKNAKEVTKWGWFKSFLLLFKKQRKLYDEWNNYIVYKKLFGIFYIIKEGHDFHNYRKYGANCNCFFEINFKNRRHE